MAPQHHPQVVATRADGLVDVAFTVVESDPDVDVLLDVDFLLYAAWPELDSLVLAREDDGTRRLVVALPAALRASYRFVRVPAGRALGTDLVALRALLATAEPDPANHDRISGAFGSEVTSSVLTLPGARTHPAWAPEGAVRRSVARREVALDDRTVTVLGDASAGTGGARRLAVFLDGDVWAGSLDLAGALARWERDDLAVAVVPTPDRINLPDRAFMADLVVDRVLPAVERVLDHRFAAEDVVVVGQSYGGLAAAGLAVDHPDRIGAAVVGSGSFWFAGDHYLQDLPDPGTLTQDVATASLTGSRFLLHVGSGERDMIGQSQMFHAAALGAGARSELDTWPGGHDYAWYRHAVLDALDRW